jgi:hypothetical protein
MALSVRTRFEVFKRDEFTCKYCGRRTPDVVLEVDHIVPVCEGGSDDTVNLTTSCYECNRGKAGVPLGQVITGEDPHDRAIELIERKRQLEEYNRVLDEDRCTREEIAWSLWRYWQEQREITAPEAMERMPKRDRTWLMNTLTYCPKTKLFEFMDAAAARGATSDFRYVIGCVKHWRELEKAAPQPVDSEDEQVFREVERMKAAELVLLAVREAEYRRVNRGSCNHASPKCSGLSECVHREARLRLGLPPSNGAPNL